MASKDKQNLQKNEVMVRFKFKDQKDGFRAVMTKDQFTNLKELPIIEYCEIVQKLGIKVESEYEKRLEKKLALALKNDKSHVKNLCYD